MVQTMYLELLSPSPPQRVTVQLKATRQRFPVVQFIMLCEMILTLESVNYIPKCDHSNESY